MTDNDKFHDVVSAYESVKLTKQELKTENETIDAEIAKAKEELDWLESSYLPLEDLKESIVEILLWGAKDYEIGTIQQGLASLATNKLWSSQLAEYGNPLKFQTIEKALSGKLGNFTACQIFTPEKSQLDDRVFLVLLFKTIEPTIRRIMEEMTPDQFGYGGITPNEIGPGLKERRELIRSIKSRIQELEYKKGANVQKISALSS